VVLINLDKRPDRLQQIREELTLLHIPPEKITRLAASENENGQRGRQQSHLQALRLAQQHGWQNYLLLEDDAVILKQEKHIQVLNALLASLAKIPWQVMILGGEISQGTMLKSLPGLVHARDCR
ncbi:glycosyltransferase family 2 protein, partial [Escherichia coli]|nr:glycosyltransferase family 2 protein [Escherichia coli]